MSMFRSVNMVHKKIRIPREHAIEFMDKLGRNTEGIEFIDKNKSNLEGKKNFYGMLKRCDDIDKKLHNIERVCERYNKELVRYTNYASFIYDLEDEVQRIKHSEKNFFDTVESEIFEDEKKLENLMSDFDTTSENLDIIKEKKAVYDKLSQLMPSSSEGIDAFRSQRLVSSSEEERVSNFNTIAGVVKAEDEIKMKRMIFRISRGRATPTFFDLEIKASGSKEKLIKKIFTIFFPGGEENILMQKIIKACDIYNASRFEIPPKDQISPEIISLQKEISEKESVLKQAKNLIEEFLRNKVGSQIDLKPARYDLIKQYIRKEKYIYNNLNKCLLLDNFVEGEIWVTEENFPHIQEDVSKLSSEIDMTANFSDLHNPKLTPPTHIKTNELSWIFQEITDAYGIPRYGEINPSLYNIVTFPFLFGIMFGDIGHGALLLLFACYLCFWHDEIKKSNSLLKNALKARYIFLFMGIFAHYMGWMYNDFLSVPLNIFGSCYVNVSIMTSIILILISAL